MQLRELNIDKIIAQFDSYIIFLDLLQREIKFADPRCKNVFLTTYLYYKNLILIPDMEMTQDVIDSVELVCECIEILKESKTGHNQLNVFLIELFTHNLEYVRLLRRLA